MSLELTLHTQPEVPLEADALSPDRLQSLSRRELEKLEVYYGNVRTPLAEFFTISGEYNGELHLSGDLSRVKHVGALMTSGNIHVHGDVGAHLGTGMTGGEIHVDGNAADWVGPEMQGGRIIVEGDAGHMIGAAYRGSPVGMIGGEIIIKGNVGNETGHAIRGGLIAVGGDSGDFTGVNMLAGTIVVCGQPGIRTAASMKRGTVVSLCDAEMLPTFSYDCCYHPVYIRLYLQYLDTIGLHVDETCINGNYERWSGDAVEMNRGEILIYRP